MLFGSRLLADPKARIGIDLRHREGVRADAPRVEARWHRDRWLLVHWYQHDEGPAVRAFTSIELEGDRVMRLRNYFYNSELLLDLAGELGLPVRINGHRWWRDPGVADG